MSEEVGWVAACGDHAAPPEYYCYDFHYQQKNYEICGVVDDDFNSGNDECDEGNDGDNERDGNYDEGKDVDDGRDEDLLQG